MSSHASGIGPRDECVNAGYAFGTFPRSSGIVALPCVGLYPCCISHALQWSVTLWHSLSVIPKAEYVIAAFGMMCGMLFQTFAVYGCYASSCSLDSCVSVAYRLGLNSYVDMQESPYKLSLHLQPAVVAAESDTAV